MPVSIVGLSFVIGWLVIAGADSLDGAGNDASADTDR